MKNRQPFRFKQFSMYHHRSTMKIGTDAMILSAWAEVSGANRVLDIGTGSGIIALMMAVRSSAVIDAVEIDEASVNEARDNFKQSPFSDRLQVFNKSMASFSESVNNTYDVIISNPPFFINDMRPQNSRKQQARHTDSLSYSDLCFYSRKMLNNEGKLCLVLPYTESKTFLSIAAGHGLFLQKRLLIFPRPCKAPNRVNLQLGTTKPATVNEEKFIIRNEDNRFTKQYSDLLGEYYISIKG